VEQASIPPACSVPKALEGKTPGAANINREPGWLATVAQGLLGTAVAVSDDHPAQLIEAGSLDPTGGGLLDELRTENLGSTPAE
jgi:hypothetical protein